MFGFNPGFLLFVIFNNLFKNSLMCVSMIFHYLNCNEQVMQGEKKLLFLDILRVK